MRPFDLAVQLVGTGMRFIPKKGFEDKQPLRRHFQAAGSALLDELLNFGFFSLSGHGEAVHNPKSN